MSPTTAAAVVETEPLLSRTSTNYGAGTAGIANGQSRAKRPTILSRLSTFHKHDAHILHEPDRSDLASTHALMPVDVIPVPSETFSNGHGKGGATGNDQQKNNSSSESDYLKSKLWWLGFLLMNIGELGNFISYAFAPASVVAPLGTFALIANCLFAPLMLKERFRKRDFFGIIVAVVGAVTVVLSTNTSDTRLDPPGLIHAMTQRVFIVYTAVYIAGAIVLSWLSEGQAGKRWVYVDVGLCALFGGFTVLSTKALSTLLTLEWLDIFTEWITYPVIAVLVSTGIGQIRYLNRALMRFDSKIVVPTQFVMFNLSAIVGSAILYGDFKQASFHQIVTFLYGCAATFAGVFIIAWAPSSIDEDSGIESMPGEDLSSIADEEVAVGFARSNRAKLVLPDDADATPILRNKHSVVSMYGLSPAQRLLVMSTPPEEDIPRSNSQDADRELHSAPDSISRRRAVSWLGDDVYGRANRRPRRVAVASYSGTRENSSTRNGDAAGDRSVSRSPY
ncbi:hypothetical protein AcV7_008314 [Taiwanofungus camphoratus]|nr:hypothetical protein AcV7_008314 [Antrodia cinnamomea]